MVYIRHKPRIENMIANDLAQVASGYKISKENLHKVIKVRGRVVETILIPLDLEKTKLGYADEGNLEVLAIDNLTDEDWRKPIVEYLQNATVSTDRKTRYRALSYVLLGSELFKKSSKGILLKCLSESEAYFALSTVHSGVCGAHQVGHKMKWFLFRQGMYWPTMLKDYIEFTKGFQECQVHAGIQHVPASELHSIIKPWPFRGWALDLIGEIRPPSSKSQRYILIWNPGDNYDGSRISITGRKMQEFSREMGFKLLTSTPYYAQDNRQVEAANEVIIGLIKKHVGKKPRNWHKTLDQIFWACCTSPKEATKSTPFRLTFGHDVVLPVEIHLQFIRIQRQHELPTESYWSMMLDELVDLDVEKLNALKLLKRQKKRIEVSYNKKVKVKSFAPEYLVWKVILPMDRKDRALGKWSPKWEGPFQVLQIFSNGAYEIEELSEDKTILRVNGKYLKKYKPIIQEVKIRDE
ncbi:uncharacterized protein LOC127081078 [Lathyrus oleraceus]|uniref:uncharacterized protein LOC127081078 n=1 Tax=Pisum sativum TaxID=3888 RepID=UPI0021D2FA75|nr:uncharacterized protein LOC127081078 [Pisum sativum]